MKRLRWQSLLIVAATIAGTATGCPRLAERVAAALERRDLEAPARDTRPRRVARCRPGRATARISHAPRPRC